MRHTTAQEPSARRPGARTGHFRTPRKPWYALAAPGVALAASLALALAACGVAPAATGTPTPTHAATTTAGGYAVKVYFSKHPDSDNDPLAVFSVNRMSPASGVATYAIGQLIAGPTPAEQAQGYYTPLTLTGTSNCGGADFTIKLNTKGSTPETGTATLQFCRTATVGGELDDPRAMAEMSQTLLQFSTIKKVVVLQPNGSCFGDLSGLNTCLK